MAGAHALHSQWSSIHVTAGQYRLLEMQHEQQLFNASKVQGLFLYLNFLDDAAFERCLGRSGKSPECLSRAPDGGPTPRKYAGVTNTLQNRKLRQQDASRSMLLGMARKEPSSLTTEETLVRLKDAFLAYTDPLLHARTGRREMNIVGWCRMLRDCRLLDNRLTLVAADVLFTRVDACADASGAHTELGDLHVDYAEFLRCLRAVVRMKFPAATDPQEALLLLARKWILPFARDSGGGGGVGASVDGLFNRASMNLIRKYDKQLKKLFAWYCSMEETDPARVTWAWVRDHSGAMISSQFVLMLLNFSVLPTLLSKNGAVEVFVRCESQNDGDEKAGTMFYPTFLETLAEVALAVGESVVQRMRAATSPDEFKVLRRYAESCPPPFGPQLLQVLQEVLAGRGRDAPSLDQHVAYDAEAVRRRNEQLAAEVLHKQEEAQTMGVVARREGMRQRFALTRLRNFYRDVRTTNNNTTWPPERDTSPTNRRGAGGGGDDDKGEEEGVHVAFYDAERAIKTPQPVWVPAGPNTGLPGRRLSANNAYIPDTPNAAAAAAAAAAAGISLGGGAANLLMLDTPTGAAAAAAARGSFVVPPSGHMARPTYTYTFGPTSPGAFRSPKPFMVPKVLLEDRDEHEAILSLAGRLPHIRGPAEGSQQGMEPMDLGSLRDDLHSRRAATAPADLNSLQGRSVGGDEGGDGAEVAASGAAAAGAGGSGAATFSGGAAALEASGASVSRPHRLPPVHHQLHRAQATAAAMAVMAGQQLPVNPLTGQLHQLPHHTASAPHLLPLVSLGHGGATGFAREVVGPQASSAVVPVLNMLPMGPSPSQLSALGVLPGSTSQHFSPTSSLTRRKPGQRKRSDVGGLPNLPVADGRPSTEVAAALRELDRFDGATMVA